MINVLENKKINRIKSEIVLNILVPEFIILFQISNETNLSSY